MHAHIMEALCFRLIQAVAQAIYDMMSVLSTGCEEEGPEHEHQARLQQGLSQGSWGCAEGGQGCRCCQGFSHASAVLPVNVLPACASATMMIGQFVHMHRMQLASNTS